MYEISYNIWTQVNQSNTQGEEISRRIADQPCLLGFDTNDFERKVLRMIFCPVNIVRKFRCRWLGHVELDGQDDKKRGYGRPKLRRKDKILRDLKVKTIGNWREEAKNRGGKKHSNFHGLYSCNKSKVSVKRKRILEPIKQPIHN